MKTTCSALVLAALALGCDESTETLTYANQGELCVSPTDTPAFEADRPIRFSITMTGCLSGSCTRNRRAACQAKVTGTAIDVASDGFFQRGGTTTCTDDCERLTAICESPPLAAGRYTVLHGQDRMELTVPSMVIPACVGRIPVGGPDLE